MVWLETVSSSHRVGLWRIDESLSWFCAHYPFGEEAPTHPERRRQFYAARVLLKTMVQEKKCVYKGLAKDNLGVPQLVAHPEHFISLSHSSRYALAAWSTQPVGVDVELVHSRLCRIRSRFLKEEECLSQDPQQLCLYWTAKEAAYKYFGSHQFSLKKDLTVLLHPPPQQKEERRSKEVISVRVRSPLGEVQMVCFLWDHHMVAYSL